MGNFVLTVLIAVSGASDFTYQGPPSLTTSTSYHSSMTACLWAAERAKRDFSGPRTGVKTSCSYRGDAVTARAPFYPW